MLKKLSVVSAIIISAAAIYAGCAAKQPKVALHEVPVSNQDGFLSKVYYPAGYLEKQALMRSLAQADQPQDKPYLAYYQYNPKSGKSSVEVINPTRWQKMGDGFRYDRLMKMYFANTRGVSRRNLLHQACYTGEAIDVLEQFFSNASQDNWIRGVKNFQSSVSSDGLMVGMQYKANKQIGKKFVEKDWHFRLTACRGAGKGEFFPAEILAKRIQQLEAQNRVPNAVADATTEKKKDETALDDINDGFVTNDEVKDANIINLPHFNLRADYEHAGNSDEPWLAEKLNLKNKEDALKFALILQKYAYEGMADQNLKNPDDNFIPENNKKRYWCHMPWLNQGANGREAVHGLTQERNLAPSAIWPKPPIGGDWGVGLFNAQGCKAIERVFGHVDGNVNDVNNRRDIVKNPEINHLNVPDGTVIFKILFTTANFKEIKKAFQWSANVSQPNDTVREVSKVRHIQMDIGIKDRRLQGLASTDGKTPDADGWLMLTYYYDESYPANDLGLHLPEGFKHMRPMGIQSGFSPDSGIIFDGAISNITKGREGMLNGPADNPKSSCMGCHGAAGTKTGMVPGVETVAEWLKLKNTEANTILDFGQQFALARRNFETREK